ncbi:hypothetical protein BH20ACT5_BH20ACT5_21070 [soil metagenome]
MPAGVRYAGRFAVLGPVLFTLAWLALGLLHQGYSTVGGTISVLAAYGAPFAVVMIAAFAVQATAMVTIAVLVGTRLPRSRPAALVLGLNGVGTLLAGLVRTVCGAQDRSWCADTGPHPTAVSAHVAIATVTLLLLAVAPLVVAGGAGRQDRRLRTVSVIVFALGTPLLVWFALDTGAGWAEKLFITLLIGWAGWLGYRAASQPVAYRS